MPERAKDSQKFFGFTWRLDQHRFSAERSSVEEFGLAYEKMRNE